MATNVSENGLDAPISHCCDAKIQFRVYESSQRVSRVVAGEIADLIRSRADEGKPCVLGLATGSTPVSVYAELVRMHREESLSLANVTSPKTTFTFPMEHWPSNKSRISVGTTNPRSNRRAASISRSLASAERDISDSTNREAAPIARPD